MNASECVATNVRQSANEWSECEIRCDGLREMFGEARSEIKRENEMAFVHNWNIFIGETKRARGREREKKQAANVSQRSKIDEKPATVHVVVAARWRSCDCVALTNSTWKKALFVHWKFNDIDLFTYYFILCIFFHIFFSSFASLLIYTEPCSRFTGAEIFSPLCALIMQHKCDAIGWTLWVYRLGYFDFWSCITFRLLPDLYAFIGSAFYRFGFACAWQRGHTFSEHANRLYTCVTWAFFSLSITWYMQKHFISPWLWIRRIFSDFPFFSVYQHTVSARRKTSVGKKIRCGQYRLKSHCTKAA